MNLKAFHNRAVGIINNKNNVKYYRHCRMNPDLYPK